ncbi:MAG: isovaleryl-CoA dehydrogenase [Egibacteraceae bacterium]
MVGTHEVRNQPSPRGGHDEFAEDPALVEAVAREGAGWALPGLGALGRLVGDPDWQERGRLANAHPPELLAYDRYGHRRDEVRYHPAYHELMTEAVARGLAAAPWAPGAPAGAHVARAARYVLWPRVDSGTLCPSTMTYAVVPSLRAQPDLARLWEPRAVTGVYDPAFGPAEGKAGATFGMAMTEKQGGSDVRANTTTAEPEGSGGPGAAHRLSGHKWFCSAPMSDAFLALAQAPGGLSCFLVPRWLPDGTRNPLRLERLKDKLGDRSNASSEVEYDGTLGWMVGEEGRGVAVILQMVAHTRLDCVSGAAGWLRQGTVEAAWHAAGRRAFGAPLARQPLMRAVLADLHLESEAATALALRLARAFDRGGDDPREAAYRRLVTPIAKYWVCKRAPAHAAEALECLGGAGYVEESGLPRLYRQSPLNGIWEGSGNVQCLDVLRAMARSPESVEVVRDEIAEAAVGEPRLAAALRRLDTDLAAPSEAGARGLVERAALALQAALLVAHAPAAVADAFCASRLGGQGGLAFGALPDGIDDGAILARALPVLA